MKNIDMENWSRRDHFDFFMRAEYPQYNVCFNLDITDFHGTIREAGLPFYHTVIYFTTAAANSIPEFRYRIRGESVVEHDILHPSFTHMRPGEDLFRMITVDMTGTLDEFLKAASEKSSKQNIFIEADKLAGRDDFLYITSLPWVSFTSISHTIRLNRDDAVPRLSWGKFFEQGGRILLPYSVHVHHGFVDGYHIGLFENRLAELLNKAEI